MVHQENMVQFSVTFRSPLVYHQLLLIMLQILWQIRAYSNPSATLSTISYWWSINKVLQLYFKNITLTKNMHLPVSAVLIHFLKKFCMSIPDFVFLNSSVRSELVLTLALNRFLLLANLLSFTISNIMWAPTLFNLYI